MKTLGALIRMHRQAKNLLIRQVAAELGIDPSLLSRIERGDKRPTRAQVVQLSELLEPDKKEFLVVYQSGKVVSILRDEAPALEAIALAEQQLNVLVLQNYNQTQRVFLVQSSHSAYYVPITTGLGLSRLRIVAGPQQEVPDS